MMWSTRLFFSLSTRRHQSCQRSVVPRYSANNNSSSLILSSSPPQYCNATTRTFFSKSLARFSRTSNNSRSVKHPNNNSFLTPGFQPTKITGDNIGFYHGSTFYDGAAPHVLPILNASPILSPGKYVRQSSWSADSKKGTKSGTDAALRLVDARREFTSLMNKELLGGGSQQFLSNNNRNHSGSDGVVTDVRKIYVLTGHGVPSELLLHLIQVVRGWTISLSSLPQSTQTHHHLSSIVQFSFQNVHNSTLLDRDQIQLIHDNGSTSKLIEDNNYQMLNHGGDWEHEFDLYMVVMDRIASRLASLVLLNPHPPHHSHADMSTTTVDGKYCNSNEEATIGSSGSLITPASLTKWNVTMMKGEALPLSLLVSSKERQQSSNTILTVEWVLNKRRNDCCNIILRLQDDGSTTDLEDGRGREPISLVFDGMYV